MLGLDTRAGGDDAPPELPTERAGSAIDPDSRWHYAASEAEGTQGPVAFSELVALWSEGGLDGNSLVWSQGMDDWSRIQDLPDVEGELRRG